MERKVVHIKFIPALEKPISKSSAALVEEPRLLLIIWHHRETVPCKGGEESECERGRCRIS